ncbi:HRQ1 [Symbiodinium sp. KB8]|nr:HRQ1 [Symbiodinium sp. KB8]
MYGFRKKAKKDHSIIALHPDAVDLTLPPVEYQTRATWMDLPGSVLQPLAQAGYSVDRGALHALEHAMIAMAPLCCDVEVMELSCQHTRRDSDPNRYFLLLYELQKGGSGASDKVYKGWEELLSQAVRLMKECPCESGCPNCIVISGCGDYNHGLEKAGALKIGAALGYGGGVATPSQTAEPKGEAENAGAADSATSTMPQPKLPPRPKKTFAQCFNCGGGAAVRGGLRGV